MGRLLGFAPLTNLLAVDFPKQCGLTKFFPFYRFGNGPRQVPCQGCLAGFRCFLWRGRLKICILVLR